MNKKLEQLIEAKLREFNWSWSKKEDSLERKLIQNAMAATKSSYVSASKKCNEFDFGNWKDSAACQEVFVLKTRIIELEKQISKCNNMRKCIGYLIISMALWVTNAVNRWRGSEFAKEFADEISDCWLLTDSIAEKYGFHIGWEDLSLHDGKKLEAKLREFSWASSKKETPSIGSELADRLWSEAIQSVALQFFAMDRECHKKFKGDKDRQKCRILGNIEVVKQYLLAIEKQIPKCDNRQCTKRLIEWIARYASLGLEGFLIGKKWEESFWNKHRKKSEFLRPLADSIAKKHGFRIEWIRNKNIWDALDSSRGPFVHDERTK